MESGIIMQCLIAWSRERDSSNQRLVPAAILIVNCLTIMFDWLFNACVVIVLS